MGTAGGLPRIWTDAGDVTAGLAIAAVSPSHSHTVRRPISGCADLAPGGGILGMATEFRTPEVAELDDVVLALRRWQREDAPIQLHPGDLG